MLKRKLLAIAVAGAFGCSAGALADSSTDYSAYNSGSASVAETVSLRTDTTLSSSEAVNFSSIEIGDGILASIVDDEFDGDVALINDTAVGASSSAAGSGTIAFNDGPITTGRPQHGNSVVEDAYLVPAPLASYDGARHWKVELSPTKAQELDRLATENVYVMIPIDDAIVDPKLALTAGPDEVLSAMLDSDNAS